MKSSHNCILVTASAVVKRSVCNGFHATLLFLHSVAVPHVFENALRAALILEN